MLNFLSSAGNVIIIWLYLDLLWYKWMLQYFVCSEDGFMLYHNSCYNIKNASCLPNTIWSDLKLKKNVWNPFEIKYCLPLPEKSAKSYIQRTIEPFIHKKEDKKLGSMNDKSQLLNNSDFLYSVYIWSCHKIKCFEAWLYMNTEIQNCVSHDDQMFFYTWQ